MSHTKWMLTQRLTKHEEREREEGDAHGPRAPSRFRLRKSWDDNQVICALGEIVDEVGNAKK